MQCGVMQVSHHVLRADDEFLHALLTHLEHPGALVLHQGQLLQHQVLGGLDLGAQVKLIGFRVRILISYMRHRQRLEEVKRTGRLCSVPFFILPQLDTLQISLNVKKDLTTLPVFPSLFTIKAISAEYSKKI